MNSYVLTHGLHEPRRARAVETGGEDPCEFPQHIAGFPSQQGTCRNDLDCYPAGTCRHTGTATPGHALTVECLYDSALLPARGINQLSKEQYFTLQQRISIMNHSPGHRLPRTIVVRLSRTKIHSARLSMVLKLKNIEYIQRLCKRHGAMYYVALG